MKKVLVLGGTGALGVYLVPELMRMGYEVDAVSLDEKESTIPQVRYYRVGNAKDPEVLQGFLNRGYNAIADFLPYAPGEFEKLCPLYLANTDHYIYQSTSRVYSDLQHPITESAPRIADIEKDPAYLAGDDSSLVRARGEDALLASGRKNWTVFRAADTYSRRRFRLTTLEANVVITRTRSGKTVLLPRGALTVQATQIWAGDVAKMIARLILFPGHFGRIYNAATAEHMSWGEVAEIYREMIGMYYVAVDNEEFLSVMPEELQTYTRNVLERDRMCARVFDNSAILNATGMKQTELMPLYLGLRQLLAALPATEVFRPTPINDRMDAYFAAHGNAKHHSLRVVPQDEI